MKLKCVRCCKLRLSQQPGQDRLLRQELASCAAGWDRPASSLRLQGPFIRLSLATNITACNLPRPIPRIHVNLISLKKYYSHSPWAARFGNKAISKQPPNPTRQVPPNSLREEIHTLQEGARKINQPCSE